MTDSQLQSELRFRERLAAAAHFADILAQEEAADRRVLDEAEEDEAAEWKEMLALERDI